MSSRSSRSSRRSTGRGRPFLWSSRTPTWHLRSLIAPMSCRPAGSCSPDRPPSCARASLCVTPISASSRSPRRPHSPPVAMAALARAALVLFLLLASSAAGMFVRPLLSEHHRSAQTNEFLRLIVTMLITFVALVLGLLTTSVKASFDKVGGEVTGFAMTWQEKPKPAGTYYLRQPSGPATAPQAENPRLGDILNHIERDIRGFNAKDEMHRRLAKDCLDQMQNLMRIRWHLIEDSESSITTPFYVVLVFWLIIVFASFGLTAPRNALSYTAIVLGALSISSAIFAILELDTPFGGIIAVSSRPMRDALAHLIH